MRPDGVRRASGNRGCSGPRSIPAGAASRAASVRPSGIRAEAVAVRPRPQRQVQESLHAAARRHRGQQLRGVASVGAARGVGACPAGHLEGHQVVELLGRGFGHPVDHASGDAGQGQQDLALVAFVGIPGEYRRRPARRVAHREGPEDDVVVTARQRRRRGQDHICMPRGLRDVRIDAHEQVQPLHRAGEPGGVRRGDHRVPRHGDQGRAPARRYPDRACRSPRPTRPPGTHPGHSAARAPGCADCPVPVPRDRGRAPRTWSGRLPGEAGTSPRPPGRGCRSGR